MTNLLIIFAGIFGLIVGSFLNVVIFRMNTGKGIGGRSHCLSCGKTLAWYELIPLVSYGIQGGKCRTCKTKISSQYFLVELITGLLFAGVMVRFAPAFLGVFSPFTLASFLFWLVLTATGIVISTYDIRHMVVDVSALLFFIALCIVGGFAGFFGGGSLSWLVVLTHIFAGIIVPLPFFLLWFISKGQLIGFGDIELMAGMGLLLGAVSGYSAVTLAFWIGAVVIGLGVLFKMVRKNKHHTFDPIPFAPFLLLGIYLVGIGGLDIFALIMQLR